MSEEQLVEKKEDTLDPSTGMPDISEEERAQGQTTGKKICGAVLPFIFIGIGIGIASIIYSCGDKDKFDSRIEIVKLYDMQWAYLSAFLFGYLVIHLNLYPMQYK